MVIDPPLTTVLGQVNSSLLSRSAPVYNDAWRDIVRIGLYLKHAGGGIMEAITIEVDERAAQAYRATSPADRRRLERLLSQRLTEYLQNPSSLEDIMRRMSRETAQRGLTLEILQNILDDED